MSHVYSVKRVNLDRQIELNNLKSNKSVMIQFPASSFVTDYHNASVHVLSAVGTCQALSLPHWKHVLCIDFALYCIVSRYCKCSLVVVEKSKFYEPLSQNELLC